MKEDREYIEYIELMEIQESIIILIEETFLLKYNYLFKKNFNYKDLINHLNRFINRIDYLIYYLEKRKKEE